MSHYVNHNRHYVRGSVLRLEEDMFHEFKGHRTIALDNLKVDFETGELVKTRQQWSKYLCGMINNGGGGKMYGGILDDGLVQGFMLSRYQIKHVLIQLKDLFSRFDPPVPRELWELEFVPIIEPFDTGYTPDPTIEGLNRQPHLDTLEHSVRTVWRCWCDNMAAASFNFGQLYPWYVIEVTIAKNNQAVKYKAEDGEVYVRHHGSTCQERDLTNVHCLRCGGTGHLSRQCPLPPPCYNCGATGHRASRCPKDNWGHTNKAKQSQMSADQLFCHECEEYGHLMSGKCLG